VTLSLNWTIHKQLLLKLSVSGPILNPQLPTYNTDTTVLFQKPLTWWCSWDRNILARFMVHTAVLLRIRSSRMWGCVAERVFLTFLRTVVPSLSGVKHSSSQTAWPFVLSKRLESFNPSPRRHIPEDLNYQLAPETQTQ